LPGGNAEHENKLLGPQAKKLTDSRKSKEKPKSERTGNEIVFGGAKITHQSKKRKRACNRKRQTDWHSGHTLGGKTVSRDTKGGRGRITGN